jgi:hypothetical protein
MCIAPDREGSCQGFPPGVRQAYQATSPIAASHAYRNETATLEELKRGRQGCTVHAQKLGDPPHRWRFWPVQRHEQRELLVSYTARPQGVIEPPRKRPRRTLRVEAKAGVAHPQCRFVWNLD